MVDATDSKSVGEIRASSSLARGTNGHGYDANGNLTGDGSTTCTCDVENLLVSASGGQNAAPNWQAMLRHGLEYGGIGPAGEAVAEAIETRLRTGRPLGTEDWIAGQEALIGKPLRPAKRGPKPREEMRRES